MRITEESQLNDTADNLLKLHLLKSHMFRVEQVEPTAINLHT